MRKVKRNRCKFEKYIDYRETVVADDINDIRVLTFDMCTDKNEFQWSHTQVINNNIMWSGDS